LSPRAKLSNEELAFCFGSCRGSETKSNVESPGITAASIDNFAVRRAVTKLSDFEETLANLVSHHEVRLDPREFPLPCPSQASRLVQSVHDELRDSWSGYQTARCDTFSLSPEAGEVFESLSLQAASELSAIESDLKAAFDLTRVLSDRDVLVKFQKVSGLLPTVSKSDFTRILYEPCWMLAINPAITTYISGPILEGLEVWHCLCVFEDKLQRLRSLSSEDDIITELQVTREFDPKKFPAWLAFEVEHQLQIRPEQALIAKHMIESPGDIMQLNMGLGKTRVIVPMLVLFWTRDCKEKTGRITRLNVLPNLFHEGKDFYRATLTGSIACIRVFTLPFCRDVVLDDRRLASLSLLLTQCRESRGIMLACPEHRLSLELKKVELHRAGRHATAELLLTNVHDSSMWREIFDESDELLHHRFRLIYATGAADNLPEATHRYRVPQLLLYLFLASPELRYWLDSNPGVLIKEGVSTSDSLPSFRLNGKLLSETKSRELRKILAKGILSDPPYELDWVRKHPALPWIQRYVVEPEACNTDDILPADRMHDVLILRGLLAGNVLTNCLQKRHRVEFGIDYSGNKRIAIPFRAADVPEARSEFAHPDSAIVLTCIAYYSDGLDANKLTEAFEVLLGLGKESKRRQYTSWFLLSKCRMGPDQERLDTVDKIDLKNQTQFKLLLKYFSRNVHTINFYLLHLVFPVEMQYYPERITATSWNLTENDGRQVFGFSGTNDNYRLLPLKVRQYFFDPSSAMPERQKRRWLTVFGTNGLMVDRMLDHTIGCRRLPATESVPGALLSFVQNSQPLVHAMIDAGALLAGVDNKAFAAMLIDVLRQQSSDHRGVTFFDPTTNKWSITEIESGRTLPTDRSSIAVEETFAFFDEPRCRGADLKLRPCAVAMLTLGPGMGKEKLMQGAGRMRLLGRGQKLVLVGTDEVFGHVDATAKTSPDVPTEMQTKRVIAWALRNTVEANANGLLSWASQGLFHATSYGDPQLTVEPEVASLWDLYEKPFVPTTVENAVDAKRHEYISRRGSDCPLDLERLATVDDISRIVSDFGCSVSHSAEGLDDECEREIELQRESEMEQEIEVPQMDAVDELDWDVSAVLSRRSPFDLPREVGVQLLRGFVRDSLLPSSLGRIDWPTNVFVTENFRRTVVDRTSRQPPKPMNSYLRLVDSCLAFTKTGDVLLLSEREADKVVERMYQCQIETPRADASDTWLFHLSLLRTSLDGTLPGLGGETMALTANRPELRTSFALPDNVVACLQLFAGETYYATPERKASLKAILAPGSRTLRSGRTPICFPSSESSDSACLADEPIHLVSMRGYAHRYPYSPLEEVCKKISSEYEAEMYRREERKSARAKGISAAAAAAATTAATAAPAPAPAAAPAPAPDPAALP
jgi:Protein of unknown function (DUF3638)/Protein of unknown function (DUF3645)